jgi:hypothetical protein
MNALTCKLVGKRQVQSHKNHVVKVVCIEW